MDVATWQASGQRVPVRASSEGSPRSLFVMQGGRPEHLPLLLLHGFPTSSWDWAHVWPMLTERFHCVAPDFLGFGFSDKPRPHPYSILEQADLVEAILDQRNLHDVHILAHDYGDTVAQELIARDRLREVRRYRSVCFLNGGLFPETHRIRPIQRLLRTPIGPWLARYFGRQSFYRSFPRVFGPDTQPSTEQLDAFWSIIATHEGARVFPWLIRYIAERRQRRARWVKAALEPPCPIQIVNGSLDPVSGAHMVARFRELGGLAAIVELPHIGHYPQVEAPDAVVSAFYDFHDALAAGM